MAVQQCCDSRALNMQLLRIQGLKCWSTIAQMQVGLRIDWGHFAARYQGMQIGRPGEASLTEDSGPRLPLRFQHHRWHRHHGD